MTTESETAVEGPPETEVPRSPNGTTGHPEGAVGERGETAPEERLGTVPDDAEDALADVPEERLEDTPDEKLEDAPDEQLEDVPDERLMQDPGAYHAVDTGAARGRAQVVPAGSVGNSGRAQVAPTGPAVRTGDIRPKPTGGNEHVGIVPDERLEDATDDPLRRRADRLQTLNEIGRVLSATLDLRTLYDASYEQIGRVMDTTHFFIALRGRNPETFAIPYLREHGKLLLDSEFPYEPSITTLVMERGIPLLFGTPSEYETFARRNGLPELMVGEHDSESQIFVPLSTGSRTIGALSVQSSRRHAYTDEDVQTLSVIAAQAAIAIENARLVSDQQQRVVELETIASIVERLIPLHDVERIAHVIGRELQSLIDYHTCRVFLLDRDERSLVPVRGADFDPAGLRLQLGEGITGSIAERGMSELVGNTLNDARGTQIAGTPVRAESMIGAPLQYEGKVRGVMTLSKLGADQFDHNALRLLEIVAGQVAIVFDRARLWEELRQQAMTDDLTGLANRRALLQRYREERRRVLRTGGQLVILMLDIDNFKRVNDRWGHEAGDTVLKELAGVIRGVVRAEDIVARYGGEEFCVLLPQIPLADAEQVAERLRATIGAYRPSPAAGVDGVKVSVGMASSSGADEEAELFGRADEAMYTVKRAGGNGVCIADGRSFRFPREPGTAPTS